MQCTNCGFQNMPGSDACGRCGTSVVLAAAIDVHPPRASRISKRLRRGVPSRAYYQARAAMEEVSTRTGRAFSISCPTLPPWPVFWRLIIPGWSHLYLGQRLRGYLFLWGFVLCLPTGLILLGTTLGSILLGAAFSIHCSAALDMVNQASPRSEFSLQMVRSLVVTGFVFVIFYLPPSWLVSHFADPHTIQWDVYPFVRGDVLLVDRMAIPAVGDVVLYEMPEHRMAGRPHMWYQYGGEHIDRILAGPGERARWRGGQLIINGISSPEKPLVPGRFTADMTFQVPPDRYLILPSTTPGFPTRSPSEIWQAIALVPRESVRGRVFFRTHPLDRFGHIR